MQNKILWCLLLTLVCIQPSYSDIYKCTDKNGIVTFSDQPCGKNSQLAFNTSSGIKAIEDSLLNFSIRVPEGNLIEMHAKMASEIKNHAHHVGSLIFPDLQFISDKTNTPEEEAIFNYGSFTKRGVYTMEINYDLNPEMFLKVRNILIKKNGEGFNPKIMDGTKKLYYYSAGYWGVKSGS